MEKKPHFGKKVTVLDSLQHGNRTLSINSCETNTLELLCPHLSRKLTPHFIYPLRHLRNLISGSHALIMGNYGKCVFSSLSLLHCLSLLPEWVLTASRCIFTLIEVDVYHHVLLQLITRLKGKGSPEFKLPGLIFKKLRTKWQICVRSKA